MSIRLNEHALCLCPRHPPLGRDGVVFMTPTLLKPEPIWSYPIHADTLQANWVSSNQLYDFWHSWRHKNACNVTHVFAEMSRIRIISIWITTKSVGFVFTSSTQLPFVHSHNAMWVTEGMYMYKYIIIFKHHQSHGCRARNFQELATSKPNIVQGTSLLLKSSLGRRFT